MNKFLTSMLNFFNSVLAVVLFIGGTLFFTNAYNFGSMSIIVGLFGGFVLSIIFCGSIALLINIKDELVTANEHLKKLSEKK